MMKNKIAIIGAGPVGLTTARLLQQNGADVAVYERDKNPQERITGGTLDIHKETGQKALKKAGLLEAFYAKARPTGQRVAMINGAIVSDEMPTEANQYDRPEIDRNDLRELLLESLKENTVFWDMQLASVTENADGYAMHFKNGTTAFADFLIIATGGVSKVRSSVTDFLPEYSGTFVIQGEVHQPNVKCPNFKKFCAEGNLIGLGEGKMLYSQVKGNGDLIYYVSFRRPENWITEHGLDFKNKSSIIDFLIDLFTNWHESYKELFAATIDFVGLAMKKMPLDKPWKNNRNNITLVGDAAHVMPPFAGVGVNIGLLDALELSENVNSGKFADTRSAIDDYERKMFVYASEAQRDTKENEDHIHSAGGINDVLEHMRLKYPDLFKLDPSQMAALKQP